MTERSIDSNLKASSQSPVHAYVLFVALDFPSGTVRLHNGIGTYRFGGEDYLGVGALGGVDAVEESVELSPPEVNLILSSVDKDIISAVRTDNVYGRQGLVYMGAVDEEGALLGTPDLWIRGRMTKKALILGNENAVSVTVESSSAKFKRRNNKRYTLEDHQADYPGDKFFEFLPYVKDARIIWGGEAVRGGTRNIDDGLVPGGGGDGGRRGGGRRGGGRRDRR